MSQENQRTNEVFMDTVSSKLGKLDETIQLQNERLSAIEGKINKAPDHSGDILEIKATVRKIQIDGARLQFPMQKMEEFSKLLTTGISTLNQPLKTEVQHHHHVPLALWTACGLFFILCLVSTGWFITAEQMGQYRENDMKYRYMKVFTDSTFSGYLFWLDSAYRAQPDRFTNAVIEKERLYKERLELLERDRSVNRRMNELDRKTGGTNVGKK